MKKATRILVALCLVSVLFGAMPLAAQKTDALGAYTPYSMFGVGEFNRMGTAFNKGMGGIGTAIRNNRFINYLNPAAIAADTLSFMLDFGMRQNNYYAKNHSTSSAYNVYNMDHIIAAFPVYKTFAMELGVMPYSHVGYKFQRSELRNEYVAEMGDLRYLNYGTGSINQASIGGGVSFFKHLALGAKGIFYFGNLKHYANAMMSANSQYAPIVTGRDLLIRAYGLQAGVQVFGRLGASKEYGYVLGASYTPAVNLRGDMKRFAYAYYSSSKPDTVYQHVVKGSGLSIPDKWAAGVSFSHYDHWTLGADFEYSDWTRVSFENYSGVDFKPCPSYAARIGFEWTPDRYDVRYFLKRITYRFGAYRERSYFTLGGAHIDATGFTLGFHVPVYRYYNSLGISLDVGQRGSLQNNLVRERYWKLVINFSLHEMWFIKKRYN